MVNQIIGNSDRGDKTKRGARLPHKRLLYCFNVNRTSPDHLLLGRSADVDKDIEWSEDSAGSGKSQNTPFLKLWVWAHESQFPIGRVNRDLYLLQERPSHSS